MSLRMKKEAPREENESSINNQKLLVQVLRNHKWKERQHLLDRARECESEGKFSDVDVHLLNWFLCGQCEGEACFGRKTGQEQMYAEVWDTVEDEHKFARMLDHPAHTFVCEKVDELWERISEP